MKKITNYLETNEMRNEYAPTLKRVSPSLREMNKGQNKLREISCS